MSSYTPPLEDIMFCITELAGLAKINELPVFSEASEDLVQAIVEEAGRFFASVLAPLNPIGDVQGVSLQDGRVITPSGFREAYQKLVDDAWISLSFPLEEGGQGLPVLVEVALTEMMQSANLAFSMCSQLAPGAARAIRAQGSADLAERFLPRIASGEWATAMSLTEPGAGSDLSRLSTRAKINGDHYLISGQKIFISWADHDMAENIVHLVLARTADAPAGTKGISLFLVPKFIPAADGSLAEQNDFSIVSLEHKLGLHASPSCAVSYGDKEGAIGYLVGEENQGLSAMFHMMNHARLNVGLQGAALVERAYQQALSFAQERVQGYAPGGRQPVAIIEHADVRRMLLSMKAGVEAMRALAYVTAAHIDHETHADDPAQREFHAARVSLLTPVVKAWSTEFAQELVQLAVQVHGGMGYVEETGVAQYMRDARVTTIYEGTSAIQAMDLVSRKLIRDGGQAFQALIDDMRATGSDCHSQLERAGAVFQQYVQRLESTANHLLGNHANKQVDVQAVAFDFMMLTGFVAGAWQMMQAALIAENCVLEGKGNSEFLQYKIVACQFYIDHLLPRAESHARIVYSGGLNTAGDFFAAHP